MPEDIADIPPHDPIRDLTSEQFEDKFLALIRNLTGEQKELLLLLMHALKDAPAEGSDGPDAELIRQCDQLHGGACCPGRSRRRI